MYPEERKGAHQQPDHDLVGDPDLGIGVKVVGGAMRAEADEPGGRQFYVFLAAVAFTARLMTVGDVHPRIRVFRRQDVVAAVSVAGFGSVVIPKSGDLDV